MFHDTNMKKSWISCHWLSLEGVMESHDTKLKVGSFPLCIHVTPPHAEYLSSREWLSNLRTLEEDPVLPVQSLWKAQPTRFFGGTWGCLFSIGAREGQWSSSIQHLLGLGHGATNTGICFSMDKRICQRRGSFVVDPIANEHSLDDLQKQDNPGWWGIYVRAVIAKMIDFLIEKIPDLKHGWSRCEIWSRCSQISKTVGLTSAARGSWSCLFSMPPFYTNRPLLFANKVALYVMSVYFGRVWHIRILCKLFYILVVTEIAIVLVGKVDAMNGKTAIVRLQKLSRTSNTCFSLHM